MELPINTLRELDEFIGRLDEMDCVLDRHVAIREAARLLIHLTHNEYYNIIDPFDKRYRDIATACLAFTHHH